MIEPVSILGRVNEWCSTEQKDLQNEVLLPESAETSDLAEKSTQNSPRVECGRSKSPIPLTTMSQTPDTYTNWFSKADSSDEDGNKVQVHQSHLDSLTKDVDKLSIKSETTTDCRGDKSPINKARPLEVTLLYDDFDTRVKYEH
jgi:hypothetical protein